MKMGDIVSTEEEDDPDDIPEGFHLQEQSPHCINMTRAEDYQVYLRQIVIEFKRLIKSGVTDIRENYSKVIQRHVLGKEGQQTNDSKQSGPGRSTCICS